MIKILRRSFVTFSLFSGGYNITGEPSRLDGRQFVINKQHHDVIKDQEKISFEAPQEVKQPSSKLEFPQYDRAFDIGPHNGKLRLLKKDKPPLIPTENLLRIGGGMYGTHNFAYLGDLYLKYDKLDKWLFHFIHHTNQPRFLARKHSFEILTQYEYDDYKPHIKLNYDYDKYNITNPLGFHNYTMEFISSIKFQNSEHKSCYLFGGLSANCNDDNVGNEYYNELHYQGIFKTIDNQSLITNIGWYFVSNKDNKDVDDTIHICEGLIGYKLEFNELSLIPKCGICVNSNPKLFGKRFGLYPGIDVDWNINQYLSLFMDWDNKMKLVTYNDLRKENPLLNWQMATILGDLYNVRVGTKAKLSKTQYVLGIGFHEYQNYHYFKQLSPDVFDTEYLKRVNVLDVFLGGSLEMDSIIFLCDMCMYTYFPERKDTVIEYKPSFTIKGNVQYNIREIVLCHICTDMLFGMKYLNNTKVSTLPPVIDISLGGDYLLKKWVSLFVDIHNVISNDNLLYDCSMIDKFKIVLGCNLHI